MGYSPEFLTDTPIDKFEYCGWVPCLSGNLDFALMTVGLAGNSFVGAKPKPELVEYIVDKFNSFSNKQDKTYHNINYARDHHPGRHYRRVVLQSWYNWRDVKKYLDGDFRIVVVAESCESADTEHRSMQGHVCIFPRAYSKDKNATQQGIKSKASQSLMRIIDLMKRAESTEERNDHWLDLHKRMVFGRPLGDDDELKEVYVVKFRIEANGLTFLTYLGDFPQGVSRPEDHEFLIVRQAYYYIKYALHRHKYHSQRADALTTVVPFNEGLKPHVGKVLMLQLKRELIHIKRRTLLNRGKYTETIDALGIISYARSLANACRNTELLTEEEQTREFASIDSLQASFETKRMNEEAAISLTERAGQFSRQWTALGLAYTSLAIIILLNLFPQSGGDENELPLLATLGELSEGQYFLLFLSGAILLYLISALIEFLRRSYLYRNLLYYLYNLKDPGIAFIFVVILLVALASWLWLTGRIPWFVTS